MSDTGAKIVDLFEALKNSLAEGRPPSPAGFEVGDRVHLRGYPEMRGPVTAVREKDGVWFARFQCAVHKRETGWLRFDQLRRALS